MQHREQAEKYASGYKIRFHRVSTFDFAITEAFLLRASWFIPDLDYFNGSQILPVFEPDFEEGWIIRFHQLEASVAVLFEPTIEIVQAVRHHPALLMKSLVDLPFAARRKALNDHVLFHVPDR